MLIVKKKKSNKNIKNEKCTSLPLMSILISQQELIFTIVYRKCMYFVCMLYSLRMNVFVYVNTYTYMYMPTSKLIHMDLPPFIQ